VQEYGLLLLCCVVLCVVDGERVDGETIVEARVVACVACCHFELASCFFRPILREWSVAATQWSVQQQQGAVISEGQHDQCIAHARPPGLATKNHSPVNQCRIAGSKRLKRLCGGPTNILVKHHFVCTLVLCLCSASWFPHWAKVRQEGVCTPNSKPYPSVLCVWCVGAHTID
jgi:hypothetical protein